jgi:hypothetical protein
MKNILAGFYVLSQKDINKMSELDSQSEVYSVVHCNNFHSNNILDYYSTYVEAAF